MIVAVDLGLSTGLVFVTDDHQLIRSETVGIKDVLPILAFMHPDVVVLEQMPTHIDIPLLAAIYEEVVEKYARMHKLELITPSVWKTMAKARKWVGRGATQHEKDAFLMLRYYLTFLPKEIEEI